MKAASKSTDEIAIKVERIEKNFRLPHEKNISLKSAIINFYKKKKTFEKQVALKDISFEIKKGEFFGIVGRNGSGKSTLLKLLAGIYTPDKGAVHINGSLTPFIELGVGFNPELTGRENVFLNGALLGFNRKEMQAMYKDIVEFAELERFMDQKLKNYSSGMQVRLAFSIAIKSKSDILLFDEVLAVGDERFQKKCLEVFRQLKKEKRTIVLVTHDMGNVEKFCDRAMVIEKDHKYEVTTPEKASVIYSRLNIDEAELDKSEKSQQTERHRHGIGGVRVKSIKTLVDDKPGKVVTVGDKLTVKIVLERDKNNVNTPVTCGLAFFNSDHLNVIGPNTEKTLGETTASEITYTLSAFPLAPSEYSITCAIYNEDTSEYYDFLDKWIRFSVVSDHTVHGIVNLDGVWNTN